MAKTEHRLHTTTKMSSVTGGAPQFLNFIETQLIPKMEQDYQAKTARESRVILGHSYGGLFGEYAFCIRNNVFGNYIMLSPSLWFDNYIPLQMEKDSRANNKNEKQLVFLGIGENEEGDRCSHLRKFCHSLHNFYSNIRLAKILKIIQPYVFQKSKYH
jgi:predicted alpha/beta superfamily hydrolase